MVKGFPNMNAIDHRPKKHNKGRRRPDTRPDGFPSRLWPVRYTIVHFRRSRWNLIPHEVSEVQVLRPELLGE